jgi:hypothetical protein
MKQQKTQASKQSPLVDRGMKQNLCVVTASCYHNALCRIDKYVSDTCIYLFVLTGKLAGGLINVCKEDFIEIPESETIRSVA